MEPRLPGCAALASRRAHGWPIVLGEGDGLKGCAARTGKPASALDPLARTQHLAVMPFRTSVSAAGSVISTCPE